MANDKWCRHYRAMASHESCEVGVVYETVRDTSERPWRYPCFISDHNDNMMMCPLFERFTQAEMDETQREIDKFLSKMKDFSERKTDVCFRCGKPVTKLKKVGRSVYADCGCRLWQGDVPKAWRTS